MRRRPPNTTSTRGHAMIAVLVTVLVLSVLAVCGRREEATRPVHQHRKNDEDFSGREGCDHRILARCQHVTVGERRDRGDEHR